MRTVWRRLFLTGLLAFAAGILPPAAMADEPNAAPPPTPLPAIASPVADFGQPSGSMVSARVFELRDDVSRFKAAVDTSASEYKSLRGVGAAGAVQYHSTVAAIVARLQAGTTRSNPILMRQWEEAEASLGEVNSSLSRLNALLNQVSTNGSMASFLVESVRAALTLGGAVDEDHDQLNALRDEVSRQIVVLDRLRDEITADIQRQTHYLVTERANLQALAFQISRGQMIGSSFSNRAITVDSSPSPSMVTLPTEAPAPAASPVEPVSRAPVVDSSKSPRSKKSTKNEPVVEDEPTAAKSSLPTQATAPAGDSVAIPNERAATGVDAANIGKLLVLIRFNQPQVDYEQPLFGAINNALDRRPEAQFTLVAVSPSVGDPVAVARSNDDAQRYADDVRRSLVQLGLSPARISQTVASSNNALTPEVHVYVR